MPVLCSSGSLRLVLVDPPPHNHLSARPSQRTRHACPRHSTAAITISQPGVHAGEACAAGPGGRADSEAHTLRV